MNEPVSEESRDVSEDDDFLLDHAYDGIQEYDNPLPRWWVWIFWGTFYFSIVYIVHYHLTGHGQSVAEAYAEDTRLFREQQAKQAMGNEVTEESLTKLMQNESLVADAESIFTRHCVQCHGPNGEGLIGPNLTDSSWIHGEGKLMDIYATIAEGVLSKGMPAWERQLRPIELGKLTAYVGKMRGKNLPGRPPEGKPIE